MMTTTMMMRTVERNASIYPKLEMLREKGIPSIDQESNASPFPESLQPKK